MTRRGPQGEALEGLDAGPQRVALGGGVEDVLAEGRYDEAGGAAGESNVVTHRIVKGQHFCASRPRWYAKRRD